MTVEDIEEAILRLPPAELDKFRAWFAEFEAGRVNKKSEPQDTARRLGRIAGRTFADFRKRLREPLVRPASVPRFRMLGYGMPPRRNSATAAISEVQRRLCCPASSPMVFPSPEALTDSHHAIRQWRKRTLTAP